MKRIILLAVMVAIGLSGMSQKMPQATEKMKMKKLVPYKHYGFHFTKAVGDTIWYNDFSNAADWTMTHTGGNGDWEIQNQDNPNAGYGTGTIHSTTWQNGFAIYDADAYGDNNGEDAYIEYVGTLDLSAYTSVAVIGQQKYRKWQTTQMFVEVSTDGTNWTSFEVNASTPTSVLDTTPFIVNVSSVAAGQSSVHIRFHYHGGWDYAWNIDDIAVIEAPEIDLVGEMFHVNFLGGGWYSTIYNNERTFFTRVESYIFNNGIYDVTPSMTITLTKDGNQVFTKTTDSTTTMQPLAPGARDTIFWNTPNDLNGLTEEDLFLDTTGTYTYHFDLTLNVDSGTDGIMTNNTPAADFTLQMSDTLMSRATTLSRLLSIASFSGTQSGDFIGTVYYLPNPDTFKSILIYLQSREGKEYAGEVQPVIYEYDFNQGAWVEKLSGDPIDVASLGDGAYFKLDFNSDGFSEIFQGGTFYGVGVKQFLDPATQYIGVGSDNVFPHDYPNSVLLNLGGTFYYTGAGVPDVKLYWPTETGNNNDTNNVVMNISKNALNVYPNPAATNIYVENNSGATIEIYNLLGEKVKTIADANRNAVVNVADLEEGTYIVKVIDGNEVKTAKVNIVK